MEQHTIHVPRDFPGLSSPTLLLEIGVWMCQSVDSLSWTGLQMFASE